MGLHTRYVPPHYLYIDPTDGNDARSGTSPAGAIKTITEHNARALRPGTNVLLRRGSTSTNLEIRPANGGLFAAPITYGAYGVGALPIVNAAAAVSHAFYVVTGRGHFVVRDLDLRGGTDTTLSISSHHLLIDGLKVSGAADRCICMIGVAANIHDVVVRNCDVTGALGYAGIYAGNSAGGDGTGPVDIQIVGNTCYSNGSHAGNDHGIYVEDGTRIAVNSNTCNNNFASGIQIKRLLNSQVVGNRLYSNGLSGLWASYLSDSCMVYVESNLIYLNVAVGITLSTTLLGDLYVQNNTIVNNRANQVSFITGIVGNVFKNNVIISDNAVVGNVRPYRVATSAEATLNVIDYNLVSYKGNTDSDKVANANSPTFFYTWAQWQGLPADAHSVYNELHPVTEWTDLHLLSTSHARGIGADLGHGHDFDKLTWSGARDAGAYKYV